MNLPLRSVYDYFDKDGLAGARNRVFEKTGFISVN